MQPPSFDEYLEEKKAKAGRGQAREDMPLVRCPTSGCTSGRIIPSWKNNLLIGLKCTNGCVYSVARNSLTGEIDYFQLEEFDIFKAHAPHVKKGMRFDTQGEPHYDMI
ncbi:MAG: hypothetical protein ABIC40_08330 [bacterium]